MRAASLLVVAFAVIACSGEDRPEASSPPARAPEAAAPPPSAGLGADSAAKTPAQSTAPVTPPPKAQPDRAPARPAPAVALGPPPFAYVGKVVYGAHLYAILAHGDRVSLVSAGDTVDGAYRVQSIHEDRIVVLQLELGKEQQVMLSSSPPALSPSPPAASGAIGVTEAASLQVTGPSRVALSEEFTLAISLDPGLNGAVAGSYVELQFDPKVLALGAKSSRAATSSGSARVDVSGAYMGHPTHAMVQFQVVAPAPTSTEIRVVPTSIEGTDGRELAVNVPQAHQLTIVRPTRSNKGS